MPLCDFNADVPVHARRALHFYCAGIDKSSDDFRADFALWMTLLSPKSYMHLVIVFVSLCGISC